MTVLWSVCRKMRVHPPLLTPAAAARWEAREAVQVRVCAFMRANGSFFAERQP